MSFYDYKIGQQIATQNYPFYALIQTAMRQADTDNLERLKTVFPEVWHELVRRYGAPGGVLPDDNDILKRYGYDNSTANCV